MFPSCICMHIYVRLCLCVCVRVCVLEATSLPVCPLSPTLTATIPVCYLYSYYKYESLKIWSIQFCPPSALPLYYENVITSRPFHSHSSLNAHCHEFKCSLCSLVSSHTCMDMWNPPCSQLIYAHTCQYFPMFSP